MSIQPDQHATFRGDLEVRVIQIAERPHPKLRDDGYFTVTVTAAVTIS